VRDKTNDFCCWTIRGSNPVASFECPQAEAKRKKSGQQAEVVVYFESFEWLRRKQKEGNASTAKRAFDFLTKLHRPDQGGTREGFLRLNDAYDWAIAAFPNAAA
jgi:hypothetical protein